MFVVGGAGTLYVDPEHTTQLKDTPSFPAEIQPLASAMGEALNLLKEAQNIHWTYISPAAMFDADGPATGHYEVAGEELTTNSQGDSYISYADYAVAMLDEVESNAHPNQRVVFINKRNKKNGASVKTTEAPFCLILLMYLLFGCSVSCCFCFFNSREPSYWIRSSIIISTSRYMINSIT